MANDFHMTVAISPQDAMTGTVRALPLPNGQQATITIPADAYDGQILWFPGYIKDSEKDIHPGALILTVQISSPEEATTNDEDIVQVTAAPSQPVESSQQTPSTYIPEQPSPASTSQRMSRNKMVILALAALLITIISSGVFLSVHAPQATDQTNTPAP